MERLRLLLVSGSLRSGSTNTAVLDTARQCAPGAVRYGGMRDLPHFNPDDDREGEPVHPAVAGLRAAVAGAEALLICTPEYAGALPGALKNLLEWTVGDAGTYGKPVAWINATGPAAPTGGADAHESLRKVLGYVGADVVDAACLRLPLTRDMVGADGTVSDPQARDQIATVLAELAGQVDRANNSHERTPMAVEHVLAVVPVSDIEAANAWYERLFGGPATNHPMESLVEWRHRRLGAGVP